MKGVVGLIAAQIRGIGLIYPPFRALALIQYNYCNNYLNLLSSSDASLSDMPASIGSVTRRSRVSSSLSAR